MKERNPTDLTTVQEHEEAQQYEAAASRKRDLSDLKSLMSEPLGRRFMWSLLARAGVFLSCFTGNSTTFFNEGKREIGLQYMHMINEACPELYHVMVTEANNIRKVDDE